MTMHDERWTLGVAENGDIRLHDLKTGDTHRFGGPRGLFDALGKLADWREGSPPAAGDDVPAVVQRYLVDDVPADPHGPHPHEGSGGRCLDCPECMTSDGARKMQQSRDYGATPIEHAEALSDWHAAHPEVAPLAQHKSDSDAPHQHHASCHGAIGELLCGHQ